MLATSASTTIVIEWLISVSPKTWKHNQLGQINISTSQLLAAAKDVADSNISPPAFIQQAFVTSITKRQRLSRWYERNSTESSTEVNQKHIYFTDVLINSYMLLFPHRDLVRTHSIESLGTTVASTINMFDVLSDQFDSAEDMERTENRGFIAAASSAVLQLTETAEKIKVQDDSLREAIDICMGIGEMQLLVSGVKLLWKRAAQNSGGIMFPAWLTTMAFNLMVTQSNMIDSKGLYNHLGVIEELRKALAEDIETTSGEGNTEHHSITDYPTMERSHDDAEKDDSYLFTDYVQGSGIKIPVEELRKFKVQNRHDQNFMSVREKRQIDSYFETQQPCDISEGRKYEKHRRAISREDEKWRTAIQSFLRSIEQGNENVEGNLSNLQTIFSGCLPFTHALNEFLNDGLCDVSDTLIFAMTLLKETCKSYLYVDGKLNPNNCRIRGLRFAQEAQHDAQALMKLSKVELTEETCKKIFALYTTCTVYRSDKRWDLYLQSPWIAGHHMAIIYNLYMEIAIRLCNEAGIIGCVLHMYNAIRQLQLDCPVLPVLEMLCDIFGKQVFIGQNRPTKNLVSIWHRYQGGSIAKTKCGVRYIDLPNVRNGGNRIGKECFMFGNNVLSPNFFKSEAFRHWIVGSFSGEDPKSPSFREKEIETAIQLHPNEMLRAVHDIAAEEFVGSRPVAAINFCKVFMFCTEILAEVGEKMNEKKPEELTATPWRSCVQGSTAGYFAFCYTMLAVDTRIKTSKQPDFSKQLSLTIQRDVLIKKCQGKTLKDFLWKNL
ncbi:hypothetical protein K469DRAFT_765022 [Zopfia rhizophila CBS 207.26]|uniref:DUF6604 domain-containing protein n=1 Tax=Zopfia rhizophila CBS 207.26 TaxID=1314779 RepID=A0A6A6D8V0_9PEZI|nr:hypothetical protein K469DRAFT_765022 [Zopfia rhizophila CBS 207.26]